MSNAEAKFYAQRDANFKDRVYRILFDDPSGHSDEEVLEIITNLCVEKLEDAIKGVELENVTDEWYDKEGNLIPWN